MSRRKTLTFRIASALLFVPLSATFVGQSAPNTEYQSRGYYKEGTRTSPSTGHANFYLLSATIDSAEGYSNLPATFRASFYVPPNVKDAQIDLTIRELDPHYDYWLSEVRPKSGWRVGGWNKFEWPTATVVRFLNYKKDVGPLGLSQLGAAARLEVGRPGREERVAPVALYYSPVPVKARAYQFVFLPDRKMHLTFKMLHEDSQLPLEIQPFPSVLGREPLVVKFNSEGWREGWYDLSIKGYSDDAPIDEIVHFYHSTQLSR